MLKGKNKTRFLVFALETVLIKSTFSLLETIVDTRFFLVGSINCTPSDKVSFTVGFLANMASTVIPNFLEIAYKVSPF